MASPSGTALGLSSKAKVGEGEAVLLLRDFPARFCSSQQHVIALPLDRLEPREVSAMIDCLVGDKSLAESARTDIIKRTAGISLFVEEITKAVLEAESHVAAERVNGAISLPAPVAPASLHVSLASHRMPLLFSSMPSCKTRLTARYCARPDARFTLASPKRLRANSQILWSATPRFSERHCTEAGLLEKATRL